MNDYFIDLTGQEPLGQGKEQLVYQHPAHADRIIKVLKPSPKVHRFRRPQVKRFKLQRVWYREMSEYIAATAHAGAHVDRLVRQFGFSDTSEGVGMVMERINGPDGNLAPTLKDAMEESRDKPEYLRSLRDDAHALFDTLRDARIDWHDLTARNVVVAGGDKPHLVIVDGLGTSVLIALTHYSDFAFRYVNQKHREKLVGIIECRLNAAVARAEAQKSPA